MYWFNKVSFLYLSTLFLGCLPNTSRIPKSGHQTKAVEFILIFEKVFSDLKKKSVVHNKKGVGVI